jgi:hypothetical protein
VLAADLPGKPQVPPGKPDLAPARRPIERETPVTE